jgi:hypothetical protein
MNNHFNVPAPPNPHRALSIGSSQMIPTAVTALLTAHQRQPRSEFTNSPPASSDVPVASCADQSGTPKSAGKGNPFQFHGVASMPLLQDRNRPLVPFYATPPRAGSQFSLRRQHSSSAAIYSTGAAKGGTKANGRYFTTPPPRVVPKGSDEEDVPVVFAASKFSDSPSAKNLPLPPPQWLDEIERRMDEKQTKVKELAGKKNTAGMDGIEEEETTSDDTGVVFDLEDVSPTSSFDNETPTTGPSSAPDSASAGVRVDPMKLIAALAVKP